MARQKRTEGLLDVTRSLFIRPGAIWTLPLNYLMQFPPNVLYYDTRSKEYYLEEDDDVWRDRTEKYALGHTEDIVLRAKVRPFLVFQKPGRVDEIKNLFVPKWYQETVSGFPITSLENLKNKEKIKIDIQRLRETNDYSFIHFLSKSDTNRLLKDSYVILSTPVTISFDFFRNHSGSLEEADVVRIKEKIARHFDL